ncbi:spore photoproduct lyase [Haloimpatiens sp. FM7315]|uniref:spore photoproduct lyase n=1 Tax=Haloimpatiens sp. FM7315 TaxID=3298609 RepID=UPI00370A0CC3
MFVPKRIIFEKGSLDYNRAKNIYDFFKKNDSVEMINITSNRVKENIPGSNLHDFYIEGKKTLVVGIKKGFKYQSCKPSANYQLPLVSGCTGKCQYCYLNTNLGYKPYVKIYANLEDVLNKAHEYIIERNPEITVFEGSATSDPVSVEPYTHLLEDTIKFFGNSSKGRFRFVTKYDDVDSLLNIEHNGNTEIRFTINTNKAKKEFESRTSSIDKRVDASVKLLKAGYPIGFIIAPVFIYEGYKEDYKNLLLDLKNKLPQNLDLPISFEVISHRYTKRAKDIINEIFKENTLPMNDNERQYKYGQFGYGKYIYNKQNLEDMKEFFLKEIKEIFPKAIIKYII